MNATTSVPEPFKVEYYCFVEEFGRLEQEVHKRLEGRRPNKRREFFQVGLLEAVETIQEIANDLGGVKFEEFYFDRGSILASNAEAPGSPELAEPEGTALSPFSKTPKNLYLSEHPKAAKVLEYNAVARTYFDRLAHVPGSMTNEFLLVLEKNPNISSQELDDLLNEPDYTRHFKPFDDLFADYFYDLCLQENMSMALEFKSDFELLGSSVTAREIFKNLSKKYQLCDNKYNIEGELFFTSVSRSFSFFSEVTTKEIIELFFEIGVDIEFDEYDNYLYLNGILATVLTDHALLLRMKETGFLLFLNAEKQKILYTEKLLREQSIKTAELKLRREHSIKTVEEKLRREQSIKKLPLAHRPLTGIDEPQSGWGPSYELLFFIVMIGALIWLGT